MKTLVKIWKIAGCIFLAPITLVCGLILVPVMSIYNLCHGIPLKVTFESIGFARELGKEEEKEEAES